MVNSEKIISKLDRFFNFVNIDTFFKSIFIQFLIDKTNYLNKIFQDDDIVEKIIDKCVYNFENNIKNIEKIEKYHSIYINYDFSQKTLKYYVTGDYIVANTRNLSIDEKKKLIINEFRIMIYKELEKIANIVVSNDEVVSVGLYIKSRSNVYSNYLGNFLDMLDIFAEAEVCDIFNLNSYIKRYVDKDRKYYVYEPHISKVNSEVIEYARLLKEIIGQKEYHLACLDPKLYTFEIINSFEKKYETVFYNDYDFLLDDKIAFSLIENYLLHIRNKINEENNLRYHKDITFALKQIIKNLPKNNENYNKFLLNIENRTNV